jgi:ANTAR domain
VGTYRAVSLGREQGESAVVARAQEIICAQVSCTPDEALLLIRARARSSDTSATYIAAAVVDGSIRFD